MVLCTHLHFDHVGWNTMLVDGRWVPTFPNAQYLFGRVEYEHWQDHDDFNIDLTDNVEPVVAAGLHRFVETDHRVTAATSPSSRRPGTRLATSACGSARTARRR